MPDDVRKRLSAEGHDSLGGTPTKKMSKGRTDKLLAEGNSEAVGMIHFAAEEFNAVSRRFTRLEHWGDGYRNGAGNARYANRNGKAAA